ncbi:MAG: cation-transporting P-type ATPase [Brumimicrobium sp.]|nr:cation-transporting P-type ATPase [Brumimicrobium sp.]
MSKKFDPKEIADKMYRSSVEEVLKELNSGPEGLSNSEADSRLDEYGPNRLKEQNKRSIWKIIFDQVNNPVIYLLTTAGILALFNGEVVEAVAILVVLFLNTMIGFWMEYSAERSMKALKEMDKVHSVVIREEDKVTIDSEKIVPGDILVLKAGDIVPADGRLMEVSNLELDESPLTGESIPVKKSVDAIGEEKQIGDRENCIFKGTAVTGGSGKAVMVSTGMATELGSISKLVGEQKREETPLNTKLNRLAKHLIYVTVGLAALFFLTGWWIGEDLYKLIQTSIAWIVAAIPEGLPIVASIALARGMMHLAKKNVIVKKLEAVETLGETTMIFTDKTGTLTENQLSVDTFSYPEQESVNVDHSDMEGTVPEGEHVKELLKIAVLANDASLDEESKDGNPPKGEGDPLEVVLLDFCKQVNEDLYDKYSSEEKKAHAPFDSDTMVMGAIYSFDDSFYVAGKGAADKVLERSKQILKEGDVEKLTNEDKEKWLKKNEELSEEGLRVLAFCYKYLDELPEEKDNPDFLKDMIFAGLVGFIDPPRSEVKEAILKAKQAGIKVVMVTGDHPGTAENVGKSIRIVAKENENSKISVSGRDLDGYLDGNKDLEGIRIFARVDPSQKLSLIEHFQNKSEIVGMTGDGVNDAPALKKANIGISMGKRGTEVAQEVSDMVLKDDAFGSIVSAVEQGRVIFGNIRKFIVYQLSYHLAEILIIGAISFGMFELPILPLQLLFLNLLSDVFPALALGVGSGNPGVMQLPPKDPEEPILTRKSWFRIGFYGVIIAASVIGAYLYATYVWDEPENVTNDVAFFSLAFAQLLHVFNMRDTQENIFNNQVTRNIYVWLALLFCFGILVLAISIPYISEVLSIESLEPRLWILIGITSLLPLFAVQIIKWIRKITG